MRKIENKSDWYDFTGDFIDNRGASGWGAFGLSQDGEGWERSFNLEYYDESDGYDSPTLAVAGFVPFRSLTPRDFVEIVESGFSYPFYIVDTGANYDWL